MGMAVCACIADWAQEPAGSRDLAGIIMSGIANRSRSYLNANIVNVVRFIEDHDAFLLQLPRHHVGHLHIATGCTIRLQVIFSV